MLQKFIEPDLAKIKVVSEDADTGSGYLEGYASVFGNTDLGGDVVEKGAFAKTLKERLKKGMIKLFDSHMLHQGTDAVIGLVEEAAEDDYGLWFKARFSSTARAQNVRTKVREGILNALSFGYEVIKDAAGPNGKTRLLKELRMYEISVVPWGMNPKAAIESVKGALPAFEFPVASKELSWDAAGAVERFKTWTNPAPVEQWAAEDWIRFSRGFLWADGEKEETVEAYHFPIVDVVDGEPRFVLGAIKAALETVRTDTARGPWDSDQDAIEAQVETLFKKFGEDMPAKLVVDPFAGVKGSMVSLTEEIKAATARVYLEQMLKGLGR